MAHDQALRLSTLCENMLKLSRLSNQEIVVNNEEVRVDEQIRKVAITLLEKWQDRDEGEGISPEKLPKVFDQFYQCEESHKQLGHGLGLAITKRIMELLGGSVEVTSTVGEGSTFTVTL